MVTPYFTNIRGQILDSLDTASQEISIAMYWFTNHQLFDKLCEKVLEGKKVELIIHNDFINNRNTGLNFQRFIDVGGQFYFSDSENPMHNKFCIIDDTILINGSYNWTYFAERKNSENILIIKEEPDTILAFKKEFSKLKGKFQPVKNIQQLTSFELDEFNGLSSREYLANDIIYEAKDTNRPEIVETAFKLSPTNIKVQEAAVKLELTRKRKLTCSIGAGIKDNKYLIGVEKGTILPISISKILVTIDHNQLDCASLLYYGDYETANLNKKMPNMSTNKHKGGVIVRGLPLKPAGEARLKMIFTIDIYAILKVKFYSLDNGNSDYYTADINGLLDDYKK